MYNRGWGNTNRKIETVINMVVKNNCLQLSKNVLFKGKRNDANKKSNKVVIMKQK